MRGLIVTTVGTPEGIQAAQHIIRTAGLTQNQDAVRLAEKSRGEDMQVHGSDEIWDYGWSRLSDSYYDKNAYKFAHCERLDIRPAFKSKAKPPTEIHATLTPKFVMNSWREREVLDVTIHSDGAKNTVKIGCSTFDASELLRVADLIRENLIK